MVIILTFFEIIHSSPGVLLNYNVFRNKNSEDRNNNMILILGGLGKKNPSPRWDLNKSQFVGLDWNRITLLHSQVMTGTQEVHTRSEEAYVEDRNTCKTTPEKKLFATQT